MSRLLRLLGGASIIAAAVSVFSPTARATTAVCFDPWSMGGSIPTVGPVCGDIKIQGGGEGGPMSVSLQHPSPVSGTSVSLTGGGGGSGIGALVALSGSYGTGHIKSTAFTPPQNGSASFTSSARGYLGTLDGFTVGSQNLNAQINLSLEGIFLSTGYGEAIFRLEDLTSNSLIIEELKANADLIHPTGTATELVSLLAGHQYIFTWGMDATADARVDFFTNHPDVAADLSNTGHPYIDVLTPDGSLAFNSGHDYSTNAVSTTPIPAALPLFASALAGMGLLARSSGSKAARRALGIRTTEGVSYAPVEVGRAVWKAI